jgi:hypothetical protein
MRVPLKSVRLKLVMVAAGLPLLLAAPARAWDAGSDPLKAEIDKFLSTIESNTSGVVSWDGSDPYEVKQDGAQSVAVITHPRLSIHGKELAQLAFDRIELRRGADPNDGKLVRYDVALPADGTLTTADGTQVKLTVNDGKATVVVEADTQNGRETALSLAGARVADAKGGAWVSFGPLSGSSKLTPDAKGGYAVVTDFAWQKIAFDIPDAPASGTIDRIAYDGKLAGPSLADLYKFQAQAREMKAQGSPDKQGAAMLALLPEFMAAYGQGNGEFDAAGLAIKGPGGPVFALAKATIGAELSGLDRDNAAVRMTLKHEGLDLAPSVLPPDKVPHSVVFDIGLENVDTAVLRAMIAAAAKMNGSEADKQLAQAQITGAAAKLNPTFRIYDIAGDTKDVGIDITGVATGSPLIQTGYTADSDVVVRGFDSLPGLVDGAPMSEYLPLLKELGTAGAATDGAPRTNFHVASTPPKWVTINGNDVSVWFLAANPAPGQPRVLKPAAPAMHGPDVGAVQHALAAAGVAVPASAAYDGPTAVAVARFQKQNKLNVTGAVDAATWQKLGAKVEPASPGPASPGSPPTRQK